MKNVLFIIIVISLYSCIHNKSNDISKIDKQISLVTPHGIRHSLDSLNILDDDLYNIIKNNNWKLDEIEITDYNKGRDNISRSGKKYSDIIIINNIISNSEGNIGKIEKNKIINLSNLDTLSGKYLIKGRSLESHLILSGVIKKYKKNILIKLKFKSPDLKSEKVYKLEDYLEEIE